MGDLEDLSITDGAASKIKEGLDHEGRKALRIALKAGGCSGFMYELTPEDEPEKRDLIFEKSGATIYVDLKSMVYLKGSTIDFVDKLIGGGIKIDNPNAVSMCGCGESFYTNPSSDD